jgi:hypothetical protein
VRWAATGAMPPGVWPQHPDHWESGATWCGAAWGVG